MKLRHRLMLLTLLVSGLMFSAQAVIASDFDTWGYHIVQPGETLYCIGRAYGVNPWDIAKHNNIDIAQANYIYPDTVLSIPDTPRVVIPPGPTCTPQFDTGQSPDFPSDQCGGCTCKAMHTVITGETLYSISAFYSVDLWSVAQCNCIYNLNYIRIADLLCIPE